MIEIYVDGSAINNENPNKPSLGGVGVCIIYNGKQESWRVEGSKVIGYYYTATDDMLEAPGSGLDLGKTTNNTTELAAIYMALRLVRGRVTNEEGEFHFEVYLHDTDHLTFEIIRDGCQPYHRRVKGMDCLYCSCSPLDLVLEPLE